jgi:hypothetical protein
MNKIQIVKLLLLVSFLKLESAVQTLSDFNNFDLKELAYKALPEKYHSLSHIYLMSRHSTQNKNTIGLLQFFNNKNNKSITHIPSDIRNKILYMILDKYVVVSKINYGDPIPYGYCNTFEHFTVSSMSKYQGRSHLVNEIQIQPNINSSFVAILNEISKGYTQNNEKDYNSIVKQFESSLSAVFFINVTITKENLWLNRQKYTWAQIQAKLEKFFADNKNDTKEYSSLLEKVKNADNNPNQNNIQLSTQEEVLFKRNIIRIEVENSVYKIFSNKASLYHVDIQLIARDQKNYDCKTASVVRVTNHISEKTISKTFDNGIVLHAFVSNDGILAVELIDETVYEAEYGNFHFKDTPNPTYHEIKLYDLSTDTLLNSIKLPLPETYVFNRYDFSLTNIYDNKVFIHSLEEDKDIIVTFNDQNNSVQNFQKDCPSLDVTPNIKVSNTIQNTDEKEPTPLTINNSPPNDPTPTRKNPIMNYIKQQIKPIIFISSAVVIFFIFKKIFALFSFCPRMT